MENISIRANTTMGESISELVPLSNAKTTAIIFMVPKAVADSEDALVVNISGAGESGSEDISYVIRSGGNDNYDAGMQPPNYENGYALLDEFISLICSYSDPPELEGDELTEYFKHEFDIWRRGEGYTNITTDANGHLVMPNHAAEYTGMWQDTYSQRCYMEIGSYDGIYYNIDINWASSAQENTHWSLWGMYDEIMGGIHYNGSRIEEYYPEEGEMQETYVYSDGEGLIWIGDDGMLYWDDYIEQQGTDCSFEKSGY